MLNSNPNLDQRLEQLEAQLEAELAPTLRDFRRASALYAEREHSLLPTHKTTGILAHWQTRDSKQTALRSHSHQRWLFTAAAACALITAASFKILKPTHTTPTATTTQTAEISDDALLENVATDLSTSVPTPLQTLAPPQSNTTTTQ